MCTKKIYDLYKQMASKIFKVPYDEVTPDQRAYAKSLGLIFHYSDKPQGTEDSNELHK